MFRYAKKLQKPIQNEFYQVMGFNVNTKRFGDGLVCDTDENIVKGLSSFLEKYGVQPREAKQFVDDNYFCYDTHEHVSVPVDNPKEIFTALKNHGIKVAICTSDLVKGKDVCVSHLGLEGLYDFSLCGDEPEMKPKPYPGNIEHVCKKVGVKPCDTIMVGDSVRDMEMAKAASVRLAVGVLSGVCDQEHLEPVADVVVPSIKHVLPLAIPGYKL